MKKLIALALTAIMILGCVSALAEEAVSTVEPIIVKNSEGNYEVSFQLPEGGEVMGQTATENTYMASIKGLNGLNMFLSVYRMEDSGDEDVPPLTYNLENGYDDEKLAEIANTIVPDFDDAEMAYLTTAYGTRLIVVRVNDPESPFAYMFTVWNNYEIGLTLEKVSEEGRFQQINDAQLDEAVAFMSELWMKDKAR